jgi:hypothetical protein
MEWPHKRFIQALLCGKMDMAGVSTEMIKWALPHNDTYARILLKDLYGKDPAYFEGKKQEITQDLLKSLKIESMYGYYFKKGVDVNLDSLQEAFNFMENREIRTLLFCTILAGMDFDEVELILNEKFDGLNATSDAIDTFVNYFFDLSGLSFKEKESLEKSFSTDLKTRRAFRLALQNDRSYMLWKLGAVPTKSFDDMMREMLTDTFYMFKEVSKDKKIDEATKIGALAVKLADRIDRLEENNKNADNIFSDLVFEPQEKTQEDLDAKTADEIGAEYGFSFKAEETDLDKIAPKRLQEEEIHGDSELDD